MRFALRFHARPRASFPLAVFFVAALGFTATGLGQLSAASSSSGSSKSSRPSSSPADLFEVLESGGDLLVEWLRPGKAEPTIENPRWNSLQSPRHSVLTFLEAMRHIESGREEAWPRALKTLAEVDDTPEEGTASRQAARHLQSVFDRLPEVSADSLPDERKVRESDMRRFELFPQGVEHQWIWEQLEEAPRGEIALVRSSDGHWVFSEETLRDIEQLAESMRPIAPRSSAEGNQGELFLSTFRPVFQQTPWWGWFALLAGIAGGCALAWFEYKLIQRIAGACRDRGWPTIAQAWEAVGRPATLLCVALGVLVGSSVIELGVTLAKLRWSAVELLLIVAGGWLVVELIDLLIISARRLLTGNEDRYTRMGTTIMRRGVRVFVAVVLAMFLLQNLLQVNLTALLGGMGLVALAVSLAAKDAVKNLFGALMVFANRPFLVGDWVTFRKQLGEVEDVSLQVTRIRLLSGELWVVPNMHFIDEPVENLSLRKYLRRTMNLQIPYDTPPKKIGRALEVLNEVLTSDEVVAEGKCRLDEKAPEISFSHFGSHYFNLRVYYWYFIEDDGQQIQRESDRGWFTYLQHCSLVNRRITERFEEEGIEFAFPTQTLYLSDDPQRELTVEMPGLAREGAGKSEASGNGRSNERLSHSS